MKILKLYVTVFASIMLTCCQGIVEDISLEDLPNLESKLVISCFISPHSPYISVVVTESQPLLSSDEYGPSYIANAEVTIAGLTGKIKIPYHDSTKHYFVDSSAFRIVPGQTYTLSVNDGKRFVKASCNVPVGVPELKFVRLEKIATESPTDSILEMSASWKDISGLINYYSLRGYLKFEISHINPGAAGPVRRKMIQEMNLRPASSNLYNDVNLDGSTFTSPRYRILQISTQPVDYFVNGTKYSLDPDLRVTEVGLEVMNLDEHYFRYQQSIASYRPDNPYVEPTPVYTNVEGGLGIFGAFHSARFNDFSGW